MFPYSQRPLTTLRTASDIERFGRQALIRAINIGRVVAFVGSGASLKFGQPYWSDVKKRASKLFFELENWIQSDPKWEEQGDFFNEFRAKLTPLAREIKELDQTDAAFDTSHFLELCEDYFEDVFGLLAKYAIFDMHSEQPLTPDDANRRRRALRTKHNEGNATDSKAHPTGWAMGQFGEDLREQDDITTIARNVTEFRAAYARQFHSIDPTDNARRALRTSAQLMGKTAQLGADWKTAPWRDHVAAFDAVGADVERIDAARNLRTKLGVRRFLTLNYDLELERMLFEEGRATPTDAYEFFRDFVNQVNFKNEEGAEYDQGPGRAVSLKSPSGRIIRSTSSRADTLADLFSFGAFPTNFDAAVHHLHGRIDDPDNMIVTAKDKQRVYYGNSEQKKSFDEARHAVFTGSDIFVLGLGTSEHDVLKPLRDFMELETDRRDAYGKVYYVTAAAQKGAKTLPEAYVRARGEAMSQTQSLHKDFGMHTLYVDFSFDITNWRGWSERAARLFTARAEVAYYASVMAAWDEKTSAPLGEISLWTNKVNDWFQSVFCTSGPDPFDPNVKPSGLTLEPPNAPRLEVKLARKLAQDWNSLHHLQTSDPTAKAKAKALNDAIQIIAARLMDSGLAEYAGELETQRKEWWSEWSERPGMRLAVLGPHGYSFAAASGEDPGQDLALNPPGANVPLVWRQTNLVTEICNEKIILGDANETPQFTALMRVTATARDAAVQASLNHMGQSAQDQRIRSLTCPAAVARVSVPPGGGKGRLLSFFTSPQKLDPEDEDRVLPFQTLFQPEFASDALSVPPAQRLQEIKAMAPANGPGRYVACYAVHLTYVLEFSSSMIAFARLLQNVLPELEKEAERGGFSAPERWAHFRDHQFHGKGPVEPFLKTLADLFELLKEACPAHGWETRVIGIFSYLDRLVDKHGDAFSPIHRAFFRLISGWDNADTHKLLPLDVVLINCQADQPIRYLSNEHFEDTPMDRRAPAWTPNVWLRRKDLGVVLEHWTQLPSVRPRIVFKEALVHAASFEDADPAVAKARADEVFAWLGGRDGTEHDHDFLPLSRNLRIFMYRRVFNGHVMAGLAYAIYRSVRAKHSTPDQQKNAFQAAWTEHCSTLDIAFMREKTRGLLVEILGVYRRLDRVVPPLEDRDGLSRRPTSPLERAKERLRTMIVDHLALLQQPVTPATLALVPGLDQSCRAVQTDWPTTPKPSSLELIRDELEQLVARGLASRYARFSATLQTQASRLFNGAAAPFVYALDTKLASALRARANLEVYSNYKLSAFQPSLYPSQPERVLKPEYAHFERVSEMLSALVGDAHDGLVSCFETNPGGPNWEPPKGFCLDMEDYNDRLRAAYALVRGTFSISVVARLSLHHDHRQPNLPFDEYRTWIRSLLNAAVLLGQIGAGYRRYQKRVGDTEALPFNQPFLRDELAWLYNERGLVSFVQGRLFDGLPLFDLASTMLTSGNGRTNPPSFEATHRRIHLNYAVAQLERGNIVTAQGTFEKIMEASGPRWSGDTPSVVHWISKGYLALSLHLTNDFPRALELYGNVLDHIGRFDHPRAESIFRRHYADLLRSMAKTRNDQRFYDKALYELRSAEELALGIRAVDIQNYALIARARLNRDLDDRGLALENLRNAESFAATMGIQKMQAEVMKVRAEVLLADGETTQAGFVAAQSIAMSKRNGMRLRKISAAIIQAQILIKRGQPMDGKRLLRETVMESQALGYATKTSYAMDILDTL
ncbi:SIR2 family protein [Roseobacteraceae bacterium S113]